MIKKISNTIINIFYPPICIVCKKFLNNERGKNYICNLCKNSIKKNIPPFCRYCSRHTEDESFICRRCQGKTFYFDRVFSACIYEGVIKELIHQFKYNSKDYLGRFLAEILIEFISTYKLPLDDIDFVVPIPLHYAKLRHREYNQALILARYVAQEFKLNLLEDALYKIKNTPSQTELEPDQRIENIKDCFKINPNISFNNKNILLIDDVFTSGATSSEAAKLFKSAGAKKVTVLVLAS